MLSKAKNLATAAHAGQRDKGGQPYILHPIAVAGRMDTELEKVVALLHDVVEDTSITLHDLELAGFGEDVLAAIDAITKRPGEPYDSYIERVKQNRTACRVKIQDLRHNIDLSRITDPKPAGYARLEKYRNTLTILEEIINR